MNADHRLAAASSEYGIFRVSYLANYLTKLFLIYSYLNGS